MSFVVIDLGFPEAEELVCLPSYHILDISPHYETDGSIMAHTDVELQNPANNGLDDIIEAERPFAVKHNVSFGDL